MLTKFAHSELPYPRVRDARGWTTELRDFLRSKYAHYYCPNFRRGNCRRTGKGACLHCAFDDVWYEPWELELDA